MPRYGRRSWYDDYDDDPYGRAWDNWYNQCHCEYYPDDDEEKGYYLDECDCCKREKEDRQLRIAAAEKQAEAWAAAEAKRAADAEARIQASPWRDEILAIRAIINRFSPHAPFEERLATFKELFTVLAGYEKFLAAQPKFRAVAKDKMAECRANPHGAEALKEVLDALDTVLASLPSVEGYRE